jgi:hypothetical protein
MNSQYMSAMGFRGFNAGVYEQPNGMRLPKYFDWIARGEPRTFREALERALSVV